MNKLPALFFLCFLFFSCSEQPTTQKKSSLTDNNSNETPANPQKATIPKITIDYDVDYLMGKITPSKDENFEQIKQKHCSRKGMYMRKDAYEAFVKMYDAALKDGVSLKIISATRPYGHQKRIWESKWSGARKVDGKDLSKTIKDPGTRALKILEYSSMPGTSRHHWGTDIDINDLNNSYFEKGTGKKVYEWLTANASKYGYCQPYSPKGKDRQHGYEEEKWHWSYLPVSKQLTHLYQKEIKNESITGFLGAESAKSIDVIQKFVLGIHPACK